MPRTRSLALASIVCGILWACGIGSLLAVVLGHLGLRRQRRHQEGGRGLALAGLTLGYAGLLLALALLLLPGGTWVSGGPVP
ncbi:MAG: DUF4190 domain-containing protein [Streptosporangiaceae bacterium]